GAAQPTESAKDSGHYQLILSIPQKSLLKLLSVMVLKAEVSVKPKYWIPPKVVPVSVSVSGAPSLKLIVTLVPSSPVAKKPKEFVKWLLLKVTEAFWMAR